MSGGVDSAVALLRARAGRHRRHAAPLARPCRAERRAGLLLTRRSHRRPRDVPRARRSRMSPSTCAKRSAPPSCSRSSTATPQASPRTRACAATARSASTHSSTSPSGPVPTCSGPGTTRASSSARGCGLSRAAATRTRTSRTCSQRSTRRCSTVSASRSEDRTRSATRRGGRGRRACRRRAARRARRRASSPAATTASFLERQGVARRPARSSTRAATSSVATTGLALHAGSAPGAAASRRRSRCMRSAPTAPPMRVVVGPRCVARVLTGRRTRDASSSRRARRRQAPVPLRARPCARRAHRRTASSLAARGAGVPRSRRARSRLSTTTMRSSAAGDHPSAATSG